MLVWRAETMKFPSRSSVTALRWNGSCGWPRFFGAVRIDSASGIVPSACHSNRTAPLSTSISWTTLSSTIPSRRPPSFDRSQGTAS